MGADDADQADAGIGLEQGEKLEEQIRIYEEHILMEIDFVAGIGAEHGFIVAAGHGAGSAYGDKLGLIALGNAKSPGIAQAFLIHFMLVHAADEGEFAVRRDVRRSCLQTFSLADEPQQHFFVYMDPAGGQAGDDLRCGALRIYRFLHDGICQLLLIHPSIGIESSQRDSARFRLDVPVQPA